MRYSLKIFEIKFHSLMLPSKCLKGPIMCRYCGNTKINGTPEKESQSSLEHKAESTESGEVEETPP